MLILAKNNRISDLPLNTSPTNADEFPINNNGVTKKLSLSGLTSFLGSTVTTKFWLENQNITLNSDETIIINGNYILSGTNITLNSDNLSFLIGDIYFHKYAQIFINGYLLLIDSNIVNNGLINVGQAIIFSGNSTITGTGILT